MIGPDAFPGLAVVVGVGNIGGNRTDRSVVLVVVCVGIGHIQRADGLVPSVVVDPAC